MRPSRCRSFRRRETLIMSYDRSSLQGKSAESNKLVTLPGSGVKSKQVDGCPIGTIIHRYQGASPVSENRELISPEQSSREKSEITNDMQHLLTTDPRTDGIDLRREFEPRNWSSLLSFFYFLFMWFTTSVCNYLHVLYSLLKTLHILFFDRIFYKGALFSCTVLRSAASSLHAVPTTT